VVLYICAVLALAGVRRDEEGKGGSVLPSFEEYFALIFHVNTLYAKECMESYMVSVLV